jgi:sterol desaturase/sphingolipid hydroxylase (fatty acid hydroxylase superfamily)
VASTKASLYDLVEDERSHSQSNQSSPTPRLATLLVMVTLVAVVVVIVALVVVTVLSVLGEVQFVLQLNTNNNIPHDNA